MIVKCEQCQTRFKIPDEKVTDKGVKVRCTKCQNTFRVTRESATAETGAPPAPPPGGQVDPFAQFGVAPDPRGVEITKPGFFAQGVEATKGSPAVRPPAAPWNSVDGDIGTEAGVFDEPTRIGPMPLPPAARPSANPFDLPQSAGPGVASPGAVPLPAPTGAVGGQARPGSATGLYGSAVPPSEAQGAYALGGAVPLPGGVRGGAVPLPGVAGVVPLPGAAGGRAAPPPPAAFASPGTGALASGPMGPGRGPAAVGTPGAAVPAPVTMFGAPKGGAPAPVAARGAAPPAGSVPPPAPGTPGFGAAPGAGAPPPFALGGDDPFADLLGGQGPAAPAGAFDLLPPPQAAPSAPMGAFDLLPSPKAPPADALRRAAAAPAPASTGAVALGPVRPAPPRAAAPSAPAPFPGEDPFGSIDIDDVTVPAAPRPAPAAVAAPAGEDPFGSIDIDDVTVTSGPTVPGAPAGEDPFASIDLGGPGAVPPAPVASAPTARGPAPVASVPAASSARGPAPASAPPGRAPVAAPQPLAPSANNLFDSGADADPFGEHAGMQPTDTGRAALLGTSPPADDGLEGFAASLEADGVSLLGDLPPMNEAQEFSVTLGRVGAPATGAVEVLDVGGLPASPSVARPTARPEDVGIPQSRPPSRARKATAFIANLVVAAVLVVGFAAVGRVYLREGRVDLSVLSPEQLRALVIPAPRPLVAVDVSNALYETKSGRPLFFVRGEAENRTGSATRIRVRAALYDGDQRVRSAEALVGAVPTPEDLYAVGNSESAAALSQRLDAAAVSVAPGAKAPFLVMFHEYPADLGGFRLEVTLEPVAPATAEAGKRTE
ncbi:zinc-ribbon domain-containing protein [Pyxidicoccus trucidator]|uniref:zinc-ribbon domain-containing protein n=1 Tax=Pyxidicoccus trucidator TaxID=2709662 RepID=UPI0013D9B4F2|nr:zinc-ribbon domain-containing protein [Pyxidicoccus trucidator]